MRAVIAQCRVEAVESPVTTVCSVFGVPRSTVYPEQRERALKPVDGVIADLIYEMIQTQPEGGDWFV